MDALRKIREASSTGAIIIVEGERDEEVLRKIGVWGEIVKYSRRNSLSRILDSLNVNKILILTDFDREGERMAKEIEFIAFINGVKVDKDLRKKLANTLRSYSLTIEGLEGVVEECLSREVVTHLSEEGCED